MAKKTQVDNEAGKPATEKKEKAAPAKKTPVKTEEKAEKPAKKEAAPKAGKSEEAVKSVKKAAAPKTAKAEAAVKPVKKETAPKAEKSGEQRGLAVVKPSAKNELAKVETSQEIAVIKTDKSEIAGIKPVVPVKPEAKPETKAEVKTEAVKEEKPEASAKQEIKTEVKTAPSAAKPEAKAAAKQPVLKARTSGSKARMRELYEQKAVPALIKHFKYKNVNEVPRLNKIVINTGMGDIKDNAKSMQLAVEELKLISGQKPVMTKAKKSVANFKVREGMNVGAKVTLRGDRMYEFADKLINIALPRVRDFRGESGKSFDGRGNYAMGVKEQLIFPEITYDQIEKIRGFDICFVTTAKTDEEARELLKLLGMPFRA